MTNISIDGKWAYLGEPTVQVRILCIDAPHKNYPIISIHPKRGLPIVHHADGRAVDDVFNTLVPLREPLETFENLNPVDQWVVTRNDAIDAIDACCYYLDKALPDDKLVDTLITELTQYKEKIGF